MVSEARPSAGAIGRRLALDKAQFVTLLSRGGDVSRALTASRGQLARLREAAAATRKTIAAMPRPCSPAAGVALELKLDSIRRSRMSGEVMERKLLLDIASNESRMRSINQGLQQAGLRLERLDTVSRSIEHVLRSEVRAREIAELADIAAAVRPPEPMAVHERSLPSVPTCHPNRLVPSEPPLGGTECMPSECGGGGGGGQPRDGRREKAIDKLRVWYHSRTANIELSYSTGSGESLMVKLSRTASGCLRAKLVAPEEASRGILLRERVSIMRSLGASGVRLESLIVTPE